MIACALARAPSSSVVITGFCCTVRAPDVASPGSETVVASEPLVTVSPPTDWRYGRLSAGRELSAPIVKVPVTAPTQASAAALAALPTV